ncbi:hypothetical protein [Dactylosporangium sp. NPDC005555]|uniref:hypothetical protein n=1 Tax=Dactylosporangium sp. NPDC005555 TaxID=3154889 RepID=UPI0033A78ADB
MTGHGSSGNAWTGVVPRRCTGSRAVDGLPARECGVAVDGLAVRNRGARRADRH